MIFIQPNKGRVLTCIVAGTDLIHYIHKINVYESLSKQYLTAKIRIIDNNNLIENLKLVGGEEVEISFDSPPNNRLYSAKMNILSMKGQQTPTNLKTIVYEIDLIGKTYFQDKANLVQDSFGTQTGTSAIQKIWNQYLNSDTLKILKESTGMLGKEDDRTTIENLKPFAAIQKLMKLLTFGDITTGNPLLFRDRDNVNLAPLEQLYKTISSQESYIQKETWGANFFDPLIYNSIIVANAEIEDREGGRSAMQDIASTKNQSQVVFDMFTGTLATNKRASSISGGFGGKSIDALAGSILGMGAGSLGGSPNVQVTQSNRWQRGTAPDTKTMQERLFSAEAKGGPQLRIKVPLQTGINATVGKGVTCQLIPPSGDLIDNPYSYGMSGLWLVKELVHEIYTDDRNVQATTSMALMRGALG